MADPVVKITKMAYIQCDRLIMITVAVIVDRNRSISLTEYLVRLTRPRMELVVRMSCCGFCRSVGYCRQGCVVFKDIQSWFESSHFVNALIIDKIVLRLRFGHIGVYFTVYDDNSVLKYFCIDCDECLSVALGVMSIVASRSHGHFGCETRNRRKSCRVILRCKRCYFCMQLNESSLIGSEQGKEH